MMSKGSLYMMDNVRSGTPLVTEIAANVRMVRGRLRFDQGIMAIRNYFGPIHPGEIYNHPWFIEKQHNPDQPSPQFHLTEEVQCCMKITKGIVTMTDIASRLDNTMGVITERNGEVTIYNPIEIDDKSLAQLTEELGADTKVTKIIVPTKQTWRSVEEWVNRHPGAQVMFSGAVPEAFLAGTHLPSHVVEKFKVMTKPMIELSNNLALLRVTGDDVTHEYVMYHDPSASLFCTDLFHGGYGDFDPVNSWLCRVWFKINRKGNHKDASILPAFKRAQVEELGSMEEVRKFVDKLTREVPIEKLVFAHGTPVLVNDEARRALRTQWGVDAPPSSPSPAATKLQG